MLQNFVKRQHKVEYSYSLDFTDEYGNGCSFPCDENGNIDESQMNEYAMANYKECIENKNEYFVPGEVVKHTNRYTESAHGKCKCGNEVYLWGTGFYGAWECESCGKWYNSCGNECYEPSMWETYDDFD